MTPKADRMVNGTRPQRQDGQWNMAAKTDWSMVHDL